MSEAGKLNSLRGRPASHQPLHWYLEF